MHFGETLTKRVFLSVFPLVILDGLHVFSHLCLHAVARIRPKIRPTSAFTFLFLPFSSLSYTQAFSFASLLNGMSAKPPHHSFALFSQKH